MIMSHEMPLTPDDSLAPKPASEMALEKSALDEILRELRALSSRMERAEKRLGLEDAAAAKREIPTAAIAPPIEPLPAPPKISAPPIPEPAPASVSIRPPSRPRSIWEPDAAVPSIPARSSAAAIPAAASREGIVSAVGAARDKIAGAGAHKKLLGDWENLIGGKWALWVGLFSLFLAIASFLAYTWKSLPPAPPSVRFAMGIAAGVALIGAGSFFRTRTQRWFNEGLAGAGLAVLYLSIWAGAQQYHLLSFGTAFTAMGLTTVLGVYLAIRFDALSLSILATLGGFLTPLLLHGKGAAVSALIDSQSLSLLTYVAVLNAGILAVSLFKRWNSLIWLSFVATVFLIGAWVMDDYSVAQRWPAFAYFSIYFLLFVGASCFYSLARKEKTAQPDLLLLFAATSVYALAGHALLDGALKPAPGTFACALALFFGFLFGAVKVLAPSNSTLRQSAGGLALLFLTVAVPIQFQGQGLAVGWCVEAGVLLLLGLRLRAALLQRAGQIVWCLSILPLLGVLMEAAPKPHILFFNERALPLLASLITTALVLFQHWATQKSSTVESQTDQRVLPPPPLLDALAPLYAGYVVLGGAWLLAQETNLWFRWNTWPSAATWPAGALYAISSLGALYAAACFAFGIKSRDAAIQLGALAVIALAMTLPLWTGVAYSTNGWTPFWNLRWLSYGVISLALAAMGWMMSRDKEGVVVGDSETAQLWPPIVSLFFLAGLTIEIYCGFAKGATLANGDWRAGAFFTIAILWSVFAAALIFLASRWRQTPLRITSLCLAASGALLLLLASVGYSDLPQTPLWNLRAGAFLVTVACSFFIAASEHRFSKADEETNSTSVAISLLSCGVLMWGLTQESSNAFSHFHSAFGAHWKLIASFAISLLWNIGSFILLQIGLRRSLPPFRIAAYSAAALSIALLLWTAVDATRTGWMPLFNARCVAFILIAVLLAASSNFLGKYRSRLSAWEAQTAANMGWLAGALLLWGITQEVYETCFYFRATLGSYWVRWAQMVISLAWSVYGAALLVGGINRNYQPLRLAALGLLAVTVSKVFLFDLGFLSGPLRMFSLAGLGIALIFISWLYGRYAKNEGAPSPFSEAINDADEP